MNESTALISSTFCSQATGEEADNTVCVVTVERQCCKKIKYIKMFIFEHEKYIPCLEKRREMTDYMGNTFVFN